MIRYQINWQKSAQPGYLKHQTNISLDLIGHVGDNNLTSKLVGGGGDGGGGDSCIDKQITKVKIDKLWECFLATGGSWTFVENIKQRFYEVKSDLQILSLFSRIHTEFYGLIIYWSQVREGQSCQILGEKLNWQKRKKIWNT